MDQGWELLPIREDQSSDALNYRTPALGGLTLSSGFGDQPHACSHPLMFTHTHTCKSKKRERKW